MSHQMAPHMGPRGMIQAQMAPGAQQPPPNMVQQMTTRAPGAQGMVRRGGPTQQQQQASYQQQQAMIQSGMGGPKMPPNASAVHSQVGLSLFIYLIMYFNI